MQKKIDPDPFTILVGILGAAGSIAGIASFFKSMSGDEDLTAVGDDTPERILRDYPEARRLAERLCNEIAVGIDELSALLNKLEYILSKQASFSESVNWKDVNVGFCTIFPLLEEEQFEEISLIHNRTNEIALNVNQKLYDMIRSIRLTNYNPSESIINDLFAVAQDLNMAMKSDTTWGYVFELYQSITQLGQSVMFAVVRDLKLSIPNNKAKVKVGEEDY